MKKNTLLLFSLLVTQTAFSNVVINEVLASNNGVNVDPDFKDNADWVELYNNGKDKHSI